MVTRRNNEEMVSLIKKGDEKVLNELTKKFFQSSRKHLRQKGIKDSETPATFAQILVNLYREIQQSNLSIQLDIEKYLFASINLFLENEKQRSKKIASQYIPLSTESEKEAVAACYSILDDNTRKLLSRRYCEKLSFEEIAAMFDYSNPVIAQFEVNKALLQLQKVSMARLNVSIKFSNE